MTDMLTRDKELGQLRADLISRDEEIESLRRENSSLRREQEAQVGMVRVLAPEIHAVWPTRVELKELFDVVVGHWPEFAVVEHDAFARTFRILGGFHRQADLDHEHSIGHWVALANERLSKRGEQGIRYMDLIAASAAWSDIALSDWRLKETEGVAFEFGLSEYVGRLPVDQWRATLRGEFVTPSDPRPKRFKASPQPSILIDGRPLPDATRFTGPAYWYEY